RFGSIKYSVNEALHHDPYGKTAVVVADADVLERLRGMGDKINQGYPVQGVVDELAAIVGRYMPDFPINEDRPQETDQNKQIIPDDEEEHLDNKQKEQSNEEPKLTKRVLPDNRRETPFYGLERFPCFIFITAAFLC